MRRGRTAQGRARSGYSATAPTTRPLLQTTDEGAPVRVDARTVATTGDRWVDPFLAANRESIERLALMSEVRSIGGVHLLLHPTGRIGAVPLVAPATRRVAAGLLVRPRFHWTALGGVLSATGFSVAPSLGGSALVPGSAREVPPWLIAGPVLRRLEALLAHRRTSFVPKAEIRPSPRGRVEWQTWARRHVPVGQWTALPCEFSDLADDPELMAGVRWTLARLADDLRADPTSIVTHQLRNWILALQLDVGSGAVRRPVRPTVGALDEWVADAVEAMGWVADERGLGGSRELDGLAWDLAVADVWEAWVRAFAAALAPRLGLAPPPAHAARRPLRWEGAVASMGALEPDVGLFGEHRVIWLDAKYKAHLSLIARRGWVGLSEAVRDAHRADLHQALAYAALADVERVDTVLVYPHLGGMDVPPPTAAATLTAGPRRIRLLLGALPFGFASPTHRDRALSEWRSLLAS